MILKVYKSGENLQLIPTYLMVGWKKMIHNFLFFSYESSESRTYMVFKQEKFLISKYHVPAIIEEGKAMSKKIQTKIDQSIKDDEKKSKDEL
jgi:hypothetical protein